MPTSTEWLGYVAAGLVLATFSARSLTTLRSVAIASNLMFIAYAASAGLLPVLILHALLLPLNGIRLCELLAQRRRRAWAPAVRVRGRVPTQRPAQEPLQRRHPHRRARRRPTGRRPRRAGGGAG